MPPEDSVTREECVGKEKEFRTSIERVHSRVDKVENTASSIETSAKIMSDCVCKIEKAMYGDQNSNGIITRVSLLDQKVSGVYWLGGVLIIALTTAFVGTIWALMTK